MVRQPIDIQWLVVRLPIRVILPVVQIKRHIQEINTSDVGLDGDMQAELVKGFGNILRNMICHTT